MLYDESLVRELMDELVIDEEEARELIDYNSVEIYDSIEDYAMERIEAEVPECVRPYVDWKDLGEDLLIDYNYFEYNNQLIVVTW